MRRVQYICDVCEKIVNDEEEFKKEFVENTAGPGTSFFTDVSGDISANTKPFKIRLCISSQEIEHICTVCYENLLSSILNDNMKFTSTD